MIKITLPDGFEEKVKPIFETLAEKIWEQIKNSSLSYTKDRTRKKFIKESDVLEFLMSPDFQKYQFDREHPWYDMIFLSGQCRLKNIRKYIKISVEITDDEHKKIENSGISENSPLSDFRKTEFFRDKIKSYLFLQSAFDYEKFLSGDDRNKLMTATNLQVCPYCNMNYIVSYQKDGKMRSTADLDHFYPKSRYPEYALCLYNMIPACQVCNSRMKGNQEMNRNKNIYPYREGFSDRASFRFCITREKPVLKLEPALELEYPAAKEQKDAKFKIENSAKIFGISERYNSDPIHAYAENLADKAVTYTDDYLEELKELSPELKKQLDQIPMKATIFGCPESEKEIAQHSLGKLRMDLLKQFRIYK